MIALVFWIALAVVLCHVCSLLEATLLSVRAPALSSAERAGSSGAARLAEIKRNRVTDAISAILTVNTLAGTIGAGFAGAQAATLFGDASVGLVSVVMTVFLLVVSEIIPKTFAATHAAALAGTAGHVLFYLVRIMAPLLYLARLITDRFAAGSSEGLTRRELAALIASAPDEGAISEGEAELLANIVYVQNVTLEQVHTPAEKVVMIEASRTVGDLLGMGEADAFSRIPIFAGQRGNVEGYVSQREILRWAVMDGARDHPLKEFIRPMPSLPSKMTIRAATDQLLHQHEAIGQVVGVKGEFIGIVTIEDLLESLIGLDITDEPEDVSALREDADRIRRKRVARLRQAKGRWVRSGRG
jgi:CBS domain containing-hemolysin-like protein